MVCTFVCREGIINLLWSGNHVLKMINSDLIMKRMQKPLRYIDQLSFSVIKRVGVDSEHVY